MRDERPDSHAAKQRDEITRFTAKYLPCFRMEGIAHKGLLRCGISTQLMSQMGQSRSFDGVCSMSELPPKADLSAASGGYINKSWRPPVPSGRAPRAQQRLQPVQPLSRSIVVCRFGDRTRPVSSFRCSPWPDIMGTHATLPGTKPRAKWSGSPGTREKPRPEGRAGRGRPVACRAAFARV